MKTKIFENPPVLPLPPNIEFPVSLIKEELKNLKFISDWNKAEVDASAGLLDFSELILKVIGFDNNLPDKFYEWYFRRQNRLIENIDKANAQEFHCRALIFYVDLIDKKRECQWHGNRIQHTQTPQSSNGNRNSISGCCLALMLEEFFSFNNQRLPYLYFLKFFKKTI